MGGRQRHIRLGSPPPAVVFFEYTYAVQYSPIQCRESHRMKDTDTVAIVLICIGITIAVAIVLFTAIACANYHNRHGIQPPRVRDPLWRERLQQRAARTAPPPTSTAIAIVIEIAERAAARTATGAPDAAAHATGGPAPSVVVAPAARDAATDAPAARDAATAAPGIDLGLAVLSGGAHHDECSICLSKFATGDEIAKLHCGHIFHWPASGECGGLRQWLRQSKVCPLCRQVTGTVALGARMPDLGARMSSLHATRAHTPAADDCPLRSTDRRVGTDPEDRARW